MKICFLAEKILFLQFIENSSLFMARIQDIKQFEELIYSAVNEYITERDNYQHPVLAIYRIKGELQLVIDDPERLTLPEDSEIYPNRACYLYQRE